MSEQGHDTNPLIDFDALRSHRSFLVRNNTDKPITFYLTAGHSFWQVAVKNKNERLMRVLSPALRDRVKKALETLATPLDLHPFEIVRELPDRSTYDPYNRFWIWIDSMPILSGMCEFNGCAYVKVRKDRWIKIYWD